METYGLGPNGGLVYCLEFLEANLDWLTEKLDALAAKGIRYYLFDFPGQVSSKGLGTPSMNSFTMAQACGGGCLIVVRWSCTHIVR